MKKLVLALVAVAAASLSFAQESMMQPIPAEMKALSHMVGKWTGTLKMTFGGTSQDSKTTAINTLEMNGRYLLTKNSYEFGGAKMEGWELLTYDPTDKKWHGWWFDSAGPGVMEFVGNVTADGKKVVLESDHKPMPGMPGKWKMRSTYDVKSEKSVGFKLEMAGDDGKWFTMIDGTLTKQSN